MTQKEKSALLEHAVINSSVEELSKIYEALGDVDMTAPALGLACRFRGIEVVKLLIQKGASFDFPKTEEMKKQYTCYVGPHHEKCRTNCSVYLLKIFGEDSGIFCLKGMTLEQNAEREQGDPLPFLPDEERVEVLKYLLENREQIAFQPEELLFYAIYVQDTAIVKELKKQDVKLSEIRRNAITDGSAAGGKCWYEYVLLTERLADDDYLEVMQMLHSEIDGKPFHYSKNILESTKKRFRGASIFEFFLASFKRDKMNQNEILRGLIDEDCVDAMPVVEREGWLNAPVKRDKMIAYASEKGKTETLAWLLEFKNRTADFAMEQAKAEKKMMRELNASPYAVSTLRKLWSYKKREDGTLIITKYKGKDIEVRVPEKIGSGIVTAIGDGAFSGDYDSLFGRVTPEQAQWHNEIVEITLPKTIQSIGEGAFFDMCKLETVDMPEGVKEIGESAFRECSSLKRISIPEGVEKIDRCLFDLCSSLEDITIPESVKEIGEYAFHGCSSLKNVILPDRLEKIEKLAFYGCSSLESITIPDGVKKIGGWAFWECRSLKNITIPGTVKKIDDCAFSYCRMLEKVHICEGVLEIGELAFMHCINLEEASVPESVQLLRTVSSTYGHDCYEVFGDCPKLIVYCPEGSKAEEYCKKNNFRYKNSQKKAD